MSFSAIVKLVLALQYLLCSCCDNKFIKHVKIHNGMVQLFRLGAGPGAGFTFHGGGHGGGGGGSWVDTVSGVSYGKSYELVEQVVGGSSGSIFTCLVSSTWHL